MQLLWKHIKVLLAREDRSFLIFWRQSQCRAIPYPAISQDKTPGIHEESRGERFVVFYNPALMNYSSFYPGLWDYLENLHLHMNLKPNGWHREERAGQSQLPAPSSLITSRRWKSTCWARAAPSQGSVSHQQCVSAANMGMVTRQWRSLPKCTPGFRLWAAHS